MAGERRTRVVQESRILHRRRADDHVRDAVVEVTLDRVEIADSAAQLHRDFLADHADDLADRELVLRDTGHSAVEIDEMQALRPQLEPVLRHRGGILGEHRRRMHLALLQADAVTVLDVDRGNDLHGGGDGRGKRMGRRRTRPAQRG